MIPNASSELKSNNSLLFEIRDFKSKGFLSSRGARMAFATLHYHSRSLQKASALNVIFPDEPEVARPWAALYLLHGLSDDYSIWARRTSIERYVSGLLLVVVMPDGGRGWYSNAVEGF